MMETDRAFARTHAPHYHRSARQDDGRDDGHPFQDRLTPDPLVARSILLLHARVSISEVSEDNSGTNTCRARIKELSRCALPAGFPFAARSLPCRHSRLRFLLSSFPIPLIGLHCKLLFTCLKQRGWTGAIIAHRTATASLVRVARQRDSKRARRQAIKIGTKNRSRPALSWNRLRPGPATTCSAIVTPRRSRIIVLEPITPQGRRSRGHPLRGVQQ